MNEMFNVQRMGFSDQIFGYYVAKQDWDLHVFRKEIGMNKTRHLHTTTETAKFFL